MRQDSERSERFGHTCLMAVCLLMFAYMVLHLAMAWATAHDDGPGSRMVEIGTACSVVRGEAMVCR